MTEHDIAIIGGGIFGVAVAKYLVEKTDLDVCVLEKEYQLATHQSGRNSGVLHPGLALTLEPDTRKATFAIEGCRRLKTYCQERNLPIRDTGLMIVATTDAEVNQLENVQNRVERLDIEIERLDGATVQEREPNVRGKAALYTPISATVETQSITHELAKDARNNGAEFYLGYTVESLDRTDGTVEIETNKGPLTAGYVVNAAGTAAVHMAHKLGIAENFSSVPFRGQYYEFTTPSLNLVQSNVYPVSMPPRVPNQVGVHFTRRPDNKIIIGPTGMIAFGLDTYEVADFDLAEIYRTISSSNFWRFIRSPDTLRIAWRELNKTYRKEVFLHHCQKLVPQLRSADLTRSYVGISHYVLDQKGRVGDESRFAFGPRSAHILRPKPGLTSSLTIGEYIADRVRSEF